MAAYAAINVPVARVFGTPLTAPMLGAAGGALSDSIATYVTAPNALAIVVLIEAAARGAPDHASVLLRPEGERQKIQESLRALDKYNGPIDGNLQTSATVKAIGDWLL